MSDTPIQDQLDSADEQMQETVMYLRNELKTIRAGRATPAMLSNVKVDYYGSKTPLNQVASVSAPQADLLIVQPFDQNAISDIERGIMMANLGLNPSNDGSVIRIPVPPLSEERRRELAGTARERAEDAKISIRNIRREIKDALQKIAKEQNISEDVRYGAEEDLQELTDKYVERINTMTERKADEIMEV